ncbi:hypothetical protein BHYA_0139g00140 [Botrytis hyacinthi]|uniref:Uncharacterized protein n=1 Tax=Botrytis hyacinthi TaxID=278943 RepID=A0A4Z1GQU0_9HELO|nr:hypothetical protein BHYA_0139g00140 [Botrytis hyacinthi]
MVSQLFYRAYSPRSAGGLVSGKANQGWHRPSHINLEREFGNHKDLSNQNPTALVSVTSSIIRALNIAFNKHYRDDEKRAEIWIAFIESRIRNQMHGDQNPVYFKDEYLFEWGVPMEYVVHGVSVQTLVDRGLNMKEYREDTWIEHQHRWREILPSTSNLRTKIANTVCDFTFGRKVHVYNSHDQFESHVRLAGMVRAFGVKALELNLLWEIFSNCCTGRFSSPRNFKQRYNAINEDCHELLLDWWLLGDEFNYDYACHLEYAFHLQETMAARWDELVKNGIDIYDDHTRCEEELEMFMEIEADAVTGL